MEKSLLRFLLFSVYQTFCPVEIEHDVFISFRGKDVRHGLRNDLINELRDKEIGGREIDVFVDDRLERGNDILPTLLKKIERSQILLVIFSPRFATSTWCLEELCKMIKCCNRSGTQILIPIFYHVSPSEVRDQSGNYESALSMHKENENKCKVKIWISALKKAAKLTGFCYPSDKYE
ncbi:hypothetical protein RIF29_29023 [Crotalaria pallida]|uniref:TIR domain-containing protein n=1 Tax=Crotalaria pallida TaxID=3830 RepID=A0AAN9HVV5_CROPI